MRFRRPDSPGPHRVDFTPGARVKLTVRVGFSCAEESIGNVKIKSIGDQVSPGRYRLHSRFVRVVNFGWGDRLVSVVSEEVGRGPINIVAGEIDSAVGDHLTVSAEKIRFGSVSVSRAGAEIYDSTWRPKALDRSVLSGNLPVLEQTLRENSPPESLVFLLDPVGGKGPPGLFGRAMRETFQAATRSLFHSPDDLVAGCRRLKGLGSGLTPAGDDFIAGLLTALVVLDRLSGTDRSKLREKMAAAARTGNLLSNSFISLAAGGWFFERLKNLLDGLAGVDPAQVRRRAGELIAFGASSGSDLAVGLLLTLKNCHGGGNISGKNGDFTDLEG